MKVQDRLMQGHFIEIHQVFAKEINLDTFLTEWYYIINGFANIYRNYTTTMEALRL